MCKFADQQGRSLGVSASTRSEQELTVVHRLIETTDELPFPKRSLAHGEVALVGAGGLAALLIWEDGGALRVPCWEHLPVQPEEP
ncbi:hypothetical protein [Streptomyces hainanensis]|uniref:Uncharacterized protein n=1 Tax=Streptomyces hainanensis TaxID=402648 RepID=A0A4R4TIE3_9ACTN|nr:hypothetical protein [Streptomyces hainanensis]TDC77370.1 hypothetical protein E1283_07580 [Streptomyces hainanensis]